MPKGDRTGPMGLGAKRGRAAGFCAGFGMPGYANTEIPRGFGMGRNRMNRGWCAFPGGGRGRQQDYTAWGPQRQGYLGDYSFAPQPFNPELEKETLKNRSLALQSELDAISKRLDELSSREKEP